jgi:hypothetical protein
MPFSTRDKTAIWVAVIGAVALITAAYLKPGETLPDHQSRISVQYSNWQTETGHHKTHSETFGRGDLDVNVSPPEKSVYLRICMMQENAGSPSCISLPRSYQSGKVSFELDVNEDLHLTKAPVIFTACAYSSQDEDEKSKINCSDPHKEDVHPPKG